jgi:hypothetical protein
MCSTPKSCITGWWIAIIFTFMLWYRNKNYDRIVAAISLIIGLIHLINYGCHSAVDPRMSGMITLALLLTLLVVVGIAVYAQTRYACLTLFGSSLAIIICLCVSLVTDGPCLSHVTSIDQYPLWTHNGSGILGDMFLPYMMVMVAFWVVLFTQSQEIDMTLIVVGAYVALSGFYALYQSELGQSSGSLWFYLLTAVPCLVWIFGLYL